MGSPAGMMRPGLLSWPRSRRLSCGRDPFATQRMRQCRGDANFGHRSDGFFFPREIHDAIVLGTAGELARIFGRAPGDEHAFDAPDHLAALQAVLGVEDGLE